LTDTGSSAAPSGPHAPDPDVEVVLFDIGGVLAPFKGLASLRRLTGGSEQDAATQWLLSPTVRRFESGAIGEQEFASGVVREWRFGLSPAQFLEQFAGWLGEPYPGAEQLVRETAGRLRVGCLSNTNLLQWREQISHWPLSGLFAERLLSFELGAVKPDREIFERVLARLALPGTAVLLLDDNPLNVQGARAAGLRAEQALEPAGARAALARLGIVAPAPG
jgi:HAD superfamily hydrolase (TIGR01509 family)